MKTKLITKHLLILVTMFIVTLFPSCNAQNNTNIQILDSIKFKVKIINKLPVGWGVKYRATIEEIMEGSIKDFNDTIIFGITTSKEYEIGDECLITLKNSKEINKAAEMLPITGTVSKQNEIWLITKIDKLTKANERSIYVGTATMIDGKAMFICDFALSEAYYLEGLKSWDKKYLNKKITVEGVLNQFIDGKSVIKDWKIIECK